MIVLVVALRCEATPLIDALDLQPVEEQGGWPLFVDRQGDTALVVSGVGRVAAAAATGWGLGRLLGNGTIGWLNMGVAGHSSLALGTVVLAHRVTERATGKRWFPPMVLGGRAITDTVITVDAPEGSYATPGAYDMEAAGFLAALARAGTAELAQVAKVVSDNPEEPIGRLDATRIGALIAAALPELLELVTRLRALTTRLEQRRAEPAGFKELVTRCHWSTTQRRQLRRLLERHHALGLSESALQSLPVTADARAVLRSLRACLEHQGVGG